MPNELLSADDLVDAEMENRRLHTGARLGRYELVMPVARGGMARVWAARLHGERGFWKEVAIKTILGELAADPVFERMFLDEAQIAAAVHHPNVCEIYELGDHEGVLFIAMEWVSGDSLARVIHKRSKTSQPIEEAAAVRVIADACAGLHAAHELCDDAGRPLSVVHRDISPHNILVTVDGIAKLADFGIAKAMSGFRNELTGAGQLKGKISYMSPEYVGGDPIDRRTDIFSMGVALYEATTGQLPFRGENEAQMLLALMEDRVVRPTRVRPGYSRELEEIVLCAIAHDAARRFPTAEAMRYALEEWLARNAGTGTHNMVAEIMRSRVGGDIDERKERIREAARHLPSRAMSGAFPVPGPSSRPSMYPSRQSIAPLSATESQPIDSVGAAMLRPREAPRKAASTTAVGILVGVGAAAVLSCLGGLAIHRLAQPEPRREAAPLPAAAVLLPPSSTVIELGDTPAAPAAVVTPDMLPSAASSASTAPARPIARSVAPIVPAPRPAAPARKNDDVLPENPYGPRAR